MRLAPPRLKSGRVLNLFNYQYTPKQKRLIQNGLLDAQGKVYIRSNPLSSTEIPLFFFNTIPVEYGFEH